MGFLRVLLAIAVLTEHSEALFGLRLTGGLIAVQLFFIISGFYMTMILESKYVGSGSYRLFLSNRLLRIFPIYWAVLALTVLSSLAWYAISGHLGSLAAYADNAGTSSILAVVIQALVNLLIIGQDTVLFLGMRSDTGAVFFTADFQSADIRFCDFLMVPQAWTLGVELLFYLVAPWLVRRSTAVVVGVVSLGLLARLVGWHLLGLDHDPWTYRFFPFELSLFLMGTLSYRIFKHLDQHEGGIFHRFRLPLTIAAYVLILGYQYLPFPGEGQKWGLYLLFSSLLLPATFSWSKSSRLDARIGDFSYPIYISHMLIIQLSMPAIRHLGWTGYTGEVVTVLTLGLSYLLIRMIADPTEAVRQARVRALSMPR